MHMGMGGDQGHVKGKYARLEMDSPELAVNLITASLATWAQSLDVHSGDIHAQLNVYCNYAGTAT
jgi:hypothetical protein